MAIAPESDTGSETELSTTWEVTGTAHPVIALTPPPSPEVTTQPTWPRPAWSLLDMLTAVIGGSGLGGIIALTAVLLLPSLVPSWPLSAVRAGGALAMSAGLCFGVWVMLRRHALSWSAIGLRSVDWRAIALMPLLALALAIVGGICFVVVLSVVGDAIRPASPEIPPTPLPLVDLVWTTLPTLLGPPVAEEVTFRGLLYPWLRGRVAARWAVVITAGLFSVSHLLYGISLPLLAPLFVLGLLLALVVERTRSLYPAIALHFSYNVIAAALTLLPAILV